MAIFEPIFQALNASGVPYVVVGGVAVVLHGHARLTVDVDVVVDLAPDSAAAAYRALQGIGFQPSVPVTAEGFADPDERRRWINDKNMTVLSMIDPDDALRRVDLFVESPIPFDELWARSVEVPLGDLSVRVAAIDDLIAMKRTAARAQDLADIEALEMIREETGGEDA